jgi:LmbE family N-acetylglucosaminyl deacetylase
MLAKQQNSVGLVTLSRGEAGSLGISRLLSPDELASRRSKELRCAAKVLGIEYLNLHNLPDKNFSDISQESGLSIVRKEIKKFNPDMIITFHTNGISGHSDHKTTSRWVHTVLKELDNPPKLFFYGLTEEQADQVQDRKLHWMTPEEITHKIDVKAYLNLKLRALECHETQAELLEKMNTSREKFVQMNEFEHFSCIIPDIHKTGIKEKFE